MKCSFVLIAFLNNENETFIGKAVRKKKSKTSLSITILKIEAYYLHNC